LAAAGATWEIDEEARGSGLLRINRLAWRFGEERLELVAEYPDLYPYFRPEVRAPSLLLPRHQSPAGNLCLVNRDTRNWDVDDTLATYLSKRLELTIRAARTSDPDEAANLEEHQGEPLSDYLPYFGSAILLVDGHWQIPDRETKGDLLVGLDPNLDLRQGLLRGAILEVRGSAGKLLAKAPDTLARLFRARVAAPWVRVGDMLALPDVGAILTNVRATAPTAVFPRAQSIGVSRVALLGLLFTEELGYRTTGQSWVFALEQTL
jgi:hypothetical protein